MIRQCLYIRKVSILSIAKQTEANKTENNAGYTAIEVACGWTGALINVVNKLFGRSSYAKTTHKRLKKLSITHRPSWGRRSREGLLRQGQKKNIKLISSKTNKLIDMHGIM